MIYLVENIKDDVTVLDICTSYNTAKELKDQYIDNFRDWDIDAADYIIIEEVVLNMDNPVIWSYDSTKAID